jgi:hypothetical protein
MRTAKPPIVPPTIAPVWFRDPVAAGVGSIVAEEVTRLLVGDVRVEVSLDV